MAKRLEVILRDSEYQQIQRAARSCQMSIAEWVRQALKLVQRQEPQRDLSKKLDAIRAATRHEFPLEISAPWLRRSKWDIPPGRRRDS